MQTLPERSQRDHWKYLYKNKNNQNSFVNTALIKSLEERYKTGHLLGPYLMEWLVYVGSLTT